MDQPKTERVLRLMKLLTGNVNYTVDELSRKLDTSYRSIYRYLDTFKEAGFVVQKNGNYYHLGKESKYFKEISQLIHFTDEEAFIVNKLIDALDDTNLLKQNLRRKLASACNCKTLADCVVNKKDAQNVHALAEAIEEKKQVVLHDYASANSGKIKDYTVEPYLFTTNYVQTWCYDLEENVNKIFKTARIGSVELIDNKWIDEKKHQVTYIDVFRMSGNKKLPVKLKLGVLSYNLLLEEYPLAERDIKKIAGNYWILETKVCNYKGVARFVIGLADDIEIIESQKLKDYIQNFCKKNLMKV